MERLGPLAYRRKSDTCCVRMVRVLSVVEITCLADTFFCLLADYLVLVLTGPSDEPLASWRTSGPLLGSRVRAFFIL